MKMLALALSAALSVPAAASPAEPGGAAPREERVPLVNFRGFRDFRAEGNELVYLRLSSRTWYRAELNGPCNELHRADTIGLDTRGSSYLDRFSALLVRGDRCQLKSLTRSAPPARERG